MIESMSYVCSNTKTLIMIDRVAWTKLISEHVQLKPNYSNINSQLQHYEKGSEIKEPTL